MSDGVIEFGKLYIYGRKRCNSAIGSALASMFLTKTDTNNNVPTLPHFTHVATEVVIFGVKL